MTPSASVKIGSVTISNTAPIAVFAGPCAMESRAHALETASALKEISERLGIARSNVSNSLKELVGWKLIRRVPIHGDRREHFEAECDVWEIASEE